MSDDDDYPGRDVEHLLSEHCTGGLIQLSRADAEDETETVGIAYCDANGTVLLAEIGGRYVGGLSMTIRGFDGDDVRKPVNMFAAPDGTVMVTLD